VAVVVDAAALTAAAVAEPISRMSATRNAMLALGKTFAATSVGLIAVLDPELLLHPAQVALELLGDPVVPDRQQDPAHPGQDARAPGRDGDPIEGRDASREGEAQRAFR
jgi:hypothetical protein